MSDRIKKLKIKKQDGTFSDYIPIGADAENIDLDYNGSDVETTLKKKPYYYDNVATMKADDTLVEGDMAITLGYYEVNDGGEAKYNITSTVSQSEYQEELENGLFATLMIENEISVKQFGAYGDGVHDDTIVIQKCFDYAVSMANNIYRGNVSFNIGQYLVTNTIVVPINKININGNGSTILTNLSDDTPAFKLCSDGTIMVNSWRTIDNLKFKENNNNSNSVCFYVGDTSRGDSTKVGAQFFIKDCNITNYNIAFYLSHNSYLFHILNCVSTSCNNFIKTNRGAMNTGENIAIKNCLIWNFTTALDISNPNTQIRVHNTSFDIGQKLLQMESLIGDDKCNVISFIDCHFEWSSDLPMITMTNSDIQKVNIVRATSFLSIDNDYLFEMNDANQFINVIDCFWDFHNNIPKYFANKSTIYMQNNDTTDQILVSPYHNLFTDPLLKWCSVSNNILLNTTGKGLYQDRVGIFRDNSSWDNSCTRMVSNNITLELDNTIIPPSGSGRSLKTTIRNEAISRIIWATPSIKTGMKKGSVKLKFSSNYNTELQIRPIYLYNGAPQEISSWFVNLDLSNIELNEWIEVKYRGDYFHTNPQAQFIGFSFDLNGSNIINDIVYYISEPELQQL